MSKEHQRVSINSFAYAFHSECGEVIDSEIFKGQPLYGNNFKKVLRNGKIWEMLVLSNFRPLMDWRSIPFTQGGALTLTHHTVNAFLSFISQQSHKVFYLTNVPLDVRFLKPKNSLEEKYFSLFTPTVVVDLLEVRKGKDGKITLTVYEIKTSSKVKPYHVVQASFYALVLEEIFKNTPVKIDREIKIIYRQAEGFKIFSKTTADKRELFNSFLQRIENLLQTKGLVPFVKSLCITRDCQKLNFCYDSAVKNLSISLFKSLKHEKQKLFQSVLVDTAKALNNYIKLLKNLNLPLGFDARAFDAELKLFKNHGVACGLFSCSQSSVIADKFNQNFLSDLKAPNTLYIDVIYGDVAPVGIVLLFSTQKGSKLDKLFTNNPKISLNKNNLYTLVFDFSCEKFSYSYPTWKRFKKLFLQLILFRELPLTVIFRNEEAQKALESILYGEIEKLINQHFDGNSSVPQLQDLIEVWRILKGIDYAYNVDKKLRVLVLEELVGKIWQTNEPFTFKLPSFMAIARLENPSLKGKSFKGIPYKKVGCSEGGELLKVETSEEEILKEHYSALFPYDPRLVELEEDLPEGGYSVNPILWDYLILTALWGVTLFGLNGEETR